jgi:hypothetical protein
MILGFIFPSEKVFFYISPLERDDHLPGHSLRGSSSSKSGMFSIQYTFFIFKSRNLRIAFTKMHAIITLIGENSPISETLDNQLFKKKEGTMKRITFIVLALALIAVFFARSQSASRRRSRRQ